MKAILLTAGFGTRLKPLTDVLPKCLLPISGHPLLEYWFSMLKDAGISSMLMNVHYLADVMRRWAGHTGYAPGLEIVHEEVLLGTGGTLLRNRDFVGDEPVMLIHADNLCATDLRAFMEAHVNRPDGVEITMMTFSTSSPETCGIVELDGDGIVRKFHEKVVNPPGNLANAAVYIIEPTVLPFLASMGKAFIDFSTEVLPAYVETGRVCAWHNGTYHRDIGNPESYLAAQIEFPRPAFLQEAAGAWTSMCTGESGALSGRMAGALSKALRAELVDLGAGPDPRLPRLAGEGKKIVATCPDFNMCPDPMKLINGRRQDLSNVLAFFTRVPGGFSSRELYERTGLRSVALYSSGS